MDYSRMHSYNNTTVSGPTLATTVTSLPSAQHSLHNSLPHAAEVTPPVPGSNDFSVMTIRVPTKKSDIMDGYESPPNNSASQEGMGAGANGSNYFGGNGGEGGLSNGQDRQDRRRSSNGSLDVAASIFSSIQTLEAAGGTLGSLGPLGANLANFVGGGGQIPMGGNFGGVNQSSGGVGGLANLGNLGNLALGGGGPAGAGGVGSNGWGFNGFHAGNNLNPNAIPGAFHMNPNLNFPGGSNSLDLEQMLNASLYGTSSQNNPLPTQPPAQGTDNFPQNSNATSHHRLLTLEDRVRLHNNGLLHGRLTPDSLNPLLGLSSQGPTANYNHIGNNASSLPTRRPSRDLLEAFSPQELLEEVSRRSLEGRLSRRNSRDLLDELGGLSRCSSRNTLLEEIQSLRGNDGRNSRNALDDISRCSSRNSMCDILGSLSYAGSVGGVGGGGRDGSHTIPPALLLSNANVANHNGERGSLLGNNANDLLREERLGLLVGGPRSTSGTSSSPQTNNHDSPNHRPTPPQTTAENDHVAKENTIKISKVKTSEKDNGDDGPPSVVTATSSAAPLPPSGSGFPKKRSNSTSSLDALLSVFGDELAELDKEQNNDDDKSTTSSLGFFNSVMESAAAAKNGQEADIIFGKGLVDGLGGRPACQRRRSSSNNSCNSNDELKSTFVKQRSNQPLKKRRSMSLDGMSALDVPPLEDVHSHLNTILGKTEEGSREEGSTYVPSFANFPPQTSSTRRSPLESEMEQSQNKLQGLYNADNNGSFPKQIPSQVLTKVRKPHEKLGPTPRVESNVKSKENRRVNERPQSKEAKQSQPPSKSKRKSSENCEEDMETLENPPVKEFLATFGEAAKASQTSMLQAIADTEESLAVIHAWDRSQGLRKCHSRTVVKTRRSRAKIKAFLLGVEPPQEPVKNRKRKNDSSDPPSGAKSKGKKVTTPAAVSTQ